MRKLALSALILGFASLLEAHVTPNVTLVRRGDFVKDSLPGATKFFEKTLGPGAVAIVQRETGWAPSSEEAKIFVGRDDGGRLVGTVVFLWVPSQHGPIGLGVAFAPDGKIRRATVTDVGTEPLVWVRPLLRDGALIGVDAVSLAESLDASRVAPQATGAMCRYYCKVVCDGIGRAQAMERADTKSK
jgi:hypothetical protein